ncbi:MAG TPA: amidohydrolase family protein [Jatrophihabitans sp.]|nr:amidohydrolase family protein [Jatrophihabitans sp.]
MPGNDIVFEHVDVVPMQSEHVLADQTVVVRDGRVDRLGPSDEAVLQPESERIDGRGKFLMPGLTDMHTHPVEERQLLLYLAHGVTTIRNMWGMPRHLKWRRSIAAGELVGPQIYTTGHYLDGCPHKLTWIHPVADKHEAVAAVHATKRDGYDAVKIDDQLRLDAYEWVIGTAAEAEIPVCGHVPFRVGLARSLAAGQVSFEHLHGYLEAALPGDRRPVGPADAREMILQELAVTPDDRFLDRVAEAAQATQAAGAWNCPTLAVRKHWTQSRAELVNSPETGFESALQIHRRRCWSDLLASATGTENGARMWELYLATTKLLSDAGAGLLTGADSGHPTQPPGTSLHRELQAFVEAGLTPYQALQAATRNSARFLGAEGEWGVVAIGARADLLLLDGNPLVDIRNASRIVGVLAAGRWFPAGALEARLHETADQPSAARTRWFTTGGFATTGSEARTYRYAMRWDGIDVGAEDVELTRMPDGSRRLRSRVAIDQLITELCLPGGEAGRYEVELTTDGSGVTRTASFECDGPDGRQRIALSPGEGGFSVDGAGLDHRQPARFDADADAVLSMPLTILWVQVGLRSVHLEVGEQAILEVVGPGLPPDFVVGRSRLELVRGPDRSINAAATARCYECRLARANMTVHAELTCDPNGIPLEVVVQAGAAMSGFRGGRFPTVIRRASRPAP